jgi:hypothetical protein
MVQIRTLWYLRGVLMSLSTSTCRPSIKMRQKITRAQGWEKYTISVRCL